MLERVAQLLLARERLLELGTQRRELGCRVEHLLLGQSRLDDRDLRLLDRRRRLLRRVPPLQVHPQTGAESLFQLRAHLRKWERFMTAGPRMTMNIAGKMKSTVGKSILIGAFIARSSAAAWRRSRESAACTRRMRPSEIPSWSAWMTERTKAATSGTLT